MMRGCNSGLRTLHAMAAAPQTQYAQSGDLSIAYQTSARGRSTCSSSRASSRTSSSCGTCPRRRTCSGGSRASVGYRVRQAGDRLLGPHPGHGERRRPDGRPAGGGRRGRASSRRTSSGSPKADRWPCCSRSTFPERVRSLVLWGTFARRRGRPTTRTGSIPRWWTRSSRTSAPSGEPGTRSKGSGRHRRSRLPDLARYERQTASPGAAATILRHNVNMDVRHALGAVPVPTLVVHRTGDPIVPFRAGRVPRSAHPRCELNVLPGEFHVAAISVKTMMPSTSIEEFVTGAPVRRDDDVDRVLKTVLFTDIVDSTAQASELGDRAWRTCSNSTTRTRPTRSRRSAASS